jgi:acetyl esterase/lipase
VVGYRPLELDLHAPPGAGPHPVIVWIHGGAWQEGGRQILPATIEPHGFYERLVARGYAVAAADYRLSREAQYPAQLDDVLAAIAWLRRHAERLRLDPGRLATFGESAGGHLAAMAGLVGRGDTAVGAVVNWYGAVDLDIDDPDDPSTPPAVLLGGPIAGRREFAQWASPVHRVHPDAPPFLSVHGTADAIVPYDQSERLTAALRAHGVRADLVAVPDAGHCFEGYEAIDGLIERCADFLDEVLT